MFRIKKLRKNNWLKQKRQKYYNKEKERKKEKKIEQMN